LEAVLTLEGLSNVSVSRGPGDLVRASAGSAPLAPANPSAAAAPEPEPLPPPPAAVLAGPMREPPFGRMAGGSPTSPGLAPAASPMVEPPFQINLGGNKPSRGGASGGSFGQRFLSGFSAMPKWQQWLAVGLLLMLLMLVLMWEPTPPKKPGSATAAPPGSAATAAPTKPAAAATGKPAAPPAAKQTSPAPEKKDAGPMPAKPVTAK
jgi:hypothetical protein